MEKIKINMMSGQAIEKPLVSAFKGNGGIYVVLDNESNGTMGLPIILVSKLENNKLTLINDAEWNAVKESLRMIIAGNQVDYVSVDESLAADDMFFKQLTLPVASFEALKNNYKPVVENASAPGASMGASSLGSAPMSSVGPMPGLNQEPIMASPMPQATTEPVMPSAPAPFDNIPPMPNIEPIASDPIAQNPMPAPEPVASGMDMNAGPMPAMDTPVMQNPLEQPQPVMDTVESIPQNVVPQAPIEPPMPSAPVEMPSPMPSVEPVPEPIENPQPVDFTVDKEAFLKACENMFDALVAKFKN